jgi:hypothetical protein
MRGYRQVVDGRVRGVSVPYAGNKYRCIHDVAVLGTLGTTQAPPDEEDHPISIRSSSFDIAFTLH